ncbi:hypothetical protein T062_18725 [Salmonella enterica subsp. arizonae]|nr:hypothetical protein [Salmonella enterica subsp. arizonae]
MTKTLNPTITVTVSGPTSSGKSRVLAVIADVLKLIHSDCIIEAPDVKAEREMCGDDHTAWYKPRSGTIFKLEEINQPINTGHCITTPITIEDLFDRPTPVHIQKLMDKLGVFIEGPEYQEADLQPVVDLVNWALTTTPVPEQTTQPDKKGNKYSSRNPDYLSGVTNKDRKNAPQVTLLAQEDIIHKVVESVAALLEYHKQQQIYREELIEKIRKELLNLHNRPG